MIYIYIPRQRGDKDELIYKLGKLPNEIAEYKSVWTKDILQKKQFPSIQPNNIVEQIFPNSLSDISKKNDSITYYNANIAALEYLYTKYFTTAIIENISKLDSKIDKDQIYNYWKFAKTFSEDMYILHQDYKKYILKQETPIMAFGPFPTFWKNPYSHETIFFDALLHYFGESSQHTAIDTEFTNTLSHIRVALEFRLRNLFGVYGLANKMSGAVSPVTVSSILEFVKTNERLIESPIPISNLKRINFYCNNYMHSGLKDYIWNPLFLYDYLIPFFTNEIKVSKDFIANLYAYLLNFEKGEEFSIWGKKPTVIIL
jgi:hypothetical protein